ncbi:hypothetical protein A3C23_04850 [Candidatus Roizmanbacteria bacterium RIFCSPHIGHO2_02_FULL_37_13b]|uniref:Cohesin domain-containing protein n=1 Tax=Candidatus Roizmanbacteria bacterium RIFCSPLOWO2_02_FULL_36_11 TaxID=1802071 RepID=A0A1F7JIC3_9BACT|nr:MAG: hypothetical protein A3C23_04850 [Candidatus Roizmanbacteria bacterium RIFCSPHIGHO2_02_FULL_37_13b]OGK55364.1 MAG: hypothetical protein A3H78_03615 [Candidatus Roizmanbacteria bacterium RIFCSPLOWO2_02_FULL_36_11]
MFSNFSNVKKKTLAQILSFLVVILIYPRLVAAGFLEFSKPIINVKVGEQFTIDVNIDAESDQVLSTDVRVIYDPKLLQIVDIKAGNYFPSAPKLDFSQSGKIYIAALVENPGDYQSGAGTVATITVKALANGTGTLTFVCEDRQTAQDSNIAKNDLNATDVIACSQNGDSDIKIGSGSTGTGSGTSGSSSTTRTSSPSSLPKSGIVDDFFKVAIPGIFLLAIGVGIRLLL